jgi:chromosome segregation ATPase
MFQKIKEFFTKVGEFFKGSKEKYEKLSDTKKKFITYSIVLLLGFTFGVIGTCSLYNKNNRDIRAKLSIVNGELKKYRSEIEDTNRLIDELRRTVERNNKTIGELKETADRISGNYIRASATAKNLTETNRILNLRIGELEQRNREYEQTISDLGSGLISLQEFSRRVREESENIRKLNDNNLKLLQENNN